MQLEESGAWSWADLLELSDLLAASWLGELGPGQGLALSLPNGPLHLIAELAAWRRGAWVVPCSDRYAPTRRRELYALVQPTLCLDVSEACPAGTKAIDPSGLLADLLRRRATGASGRDEWHPCASTDPCLLLFTSGSTGTAKAVMLSHDNLCSQQAAFALLWPGVGPGDRLVSYLPWCHSFGALAERLWALCRGVTMHLVPEGGHDHEALVDMVRSVKPSVFMSVPRMYRILCAADAFAGWQPRWVFTAGAPLGTSESAYFAARRIPVKEGWGLTETSPSATITTDPAHDPTSGLVGWPIPGVAVGVRSDDGRIFVTGPGVMLGYRNDPAATAAVLQDGIIDSGDCGCWTADGLRLLGRADQCCKLENGEKVSLTAIEDRFQTTTGHPAVAMVEQGRLILLVEATDADQLRDLLEKYNAACTSPWERTRTAAWHPDWSRQTGWLTPSHKVAKAEILAAWHDRRFRSLDL